MIITLTGCRDANNSAMSHEAMKHTDVKQKIYTFDIQMIKSDVNVEALASVSDESLDNYTGWTKEEIYTYYYINGIKQTGWLKHEDTGNMYFLNHNGIMRTGWVAIWGNTLNAYFFNENGIWDGVEHPISAYKPETLGAFLLDHYYPFSANYDAIIGNNFNNIRKFTNIEVALNILIKDFNAILIYDEVSYGEACFVVEVNLDIHRGMDDIFIRTHNNGKLAAPGLHFSKNNNGDSFFHSPFYFFGVKLSTPDAYDEIYKYIDN